MSLLVTAEYLQTRSAVALDSLSALTAGLRSELTPLLELAALGAELPVVPREKALLSRSGGRCTIDGALLRFDPFDPRHVCPVCNREYAGGLHDRFRLYWYQLWLAERVVHAALLGVLTNDESCRDGAAALLNQISEQYLRYPNADNVLGPSRPFFSTYLESIWLLQLMIALDLLETGAPSAELASLGARVRDRLIAPSAALIGSFDEGKSNRQVWNNAALLAAARMLDDRVCFDKALHGKSGLHSHLGNALLADGSWFEGENYHLFAHRGLWYGAMLASAAGHPLPTLLEDRFCEGFAAPFRTLLPDLTHPSRRDSQHCVSVRQPRFAESCELGLARRDDVRLVSMLARLYDPSIPRRDTGRPSSSADVERNLPPTGLARSDLSWRALLCAREALSLVAQPFVSDLLPAQGLGILRRDGGRVYVSLDYGHSGGGHGHPDRLNLTLIDGEHRFFDDPGTGSYVDPILHWYRSTLAHNAPLVDGHSQPRVHGALQAYDDEKRAGWVSAHAQLAPDLDVRRTIVVLDHYIVDELRWHGSDSHEVALPFHGVHLVTEGAVPAPMDGGGGHEDGFEFLADTARLTLAKGEQFEMIGQGRGGERLRGRTVAPAGATVWSATAPAPPGSPGRDPLVLVRKSSRNGTYITVWSWTDAVASIERDGDEILVELRDGARHRHSRRTHGWCIEAIHAGVRDVIDLRGTVPRGSDIAPRLTPVSGTHWVVPAASTLPATFELGEHHYRRSEFTWQGAGAPRATVTVSRPTPGKVFVEIDVPASHRLFVPLTTENQLDNEPASINGDSVQLYAMAGARTAGVLLVPDGAHLSMRPIAGWTNDLAVDARWRMTSEGYHVEATLHIDGRTPEFALDVLVNEVVPGRARRRGQLVLSGGEGEFVYLRGDRHDPARLIRFALVNV
ncbi:MAG: Heparinase family protein [Gemmatimonadetes bacterium]|nr:Heparinase family protein [Gemmatimonadota bacterium]